MTQKERWEAYRKMAQKLYPEAKVDPLAAIQEDAEMTGGFIQIAVWIPIEWLNKDKS